jgi:hypothetical protein
MYMGINGMIYDTISFEELQYTTAAVSTNCLQQNIKLLEADGTNSDFILKLRLEGHIKGIDRRKLRWVKSGINQ